MDVIVDMITEISIDISIVPVFSCTFLRTVNIFCSLSKNARLMKKEME